MAFRVSQFISICILTFMKSKTLFIKVIKCVFRTSWLINIEPSQPRNKFSKKAKAPDMEAKTDRPAWMVIALVIVEPLRSATDRFLGFLMKHLVFELSFLGSLLTDQLLGLSFGGAPRPLRNWWWFWAVLKSRLKSFSRHEMDQFWVNWTCSTQHTNQKSFRSLLGWSCKSVGK